ncbi:MAG TPA: pyruvate:ferredoxin (flavodoxin) oxidoreductase [Motilibacterales bacterium]|nr:pyruvate:ferredoxin (flavodoxin) oxidoreductase [Motilibacterales bacterium]
MPQPTRSVMDANEAVARVAHLYSEVIPIYPITPASPMAEHADAWSAKQRRNLWGTVPEVTSLQSEAGAAGALHGAVTRGALGTTFTASQGLLLMIPNMYKIAGELTPTVIHVAARTLATHALSIFGDHSDVMSARQTGFAMLCASSVQEAGDFAAVAHVATLASRVPFMHFFDGFRTSHELATIDLIDEQTLRDLIDPRDLAAHRLRGLDPDRPVLRGTAQNPDVFFQAREAANPFHEAVPRIVAETFDRIAESTGRRYGLVDYVGHPEADRVIVLMGSGAGAVGEAVETLAHRGERVGLLVVRLYRPFPVGALIAALPPTVRTLAVLDRTKEPGAPADPLHLDVMAALFDPRATARFTGGLPRTIGVRYGLSSKEFTPAMAAAVFTEASTATPLRQSVVGIVDDVSKNSLEIPMDFPADASRVKAVFYGLGSDGTVGANKNTATIVGGATDLNVQAYFVYDSKKSGSVTVSHLRFDEDPITSTYLISEATFVGVHQWGLMEKLNVLAVAGHGARVLLNAPYAADEVWDQLPKEVQQQVLAKDLDLWTIDASAVARAAGIGGRINTVMQACFFAISGVLPLDEAMPRLTEAVRKSYGKRGAVVVERNIAAIEAATAQLHPVPVPEFATSTRHRRPAVPEHVPDFVARVTGRMIAGEGDLLPVSALPVDGAFPTGTAAYEKRTIAAKIPIWEPDLCIDCGKCTIVCPHAAIRMSVFDPAQNPGHADLPSKGFRNREKSGLAITIQVAPDDCTGCGVCVGQCPAFDKSEVRRKAINMAPIAEHLEVERTRWDAFLDITPADQALWSPDTVKASQMRQPLMEFSGACAGCGETPYLKLITQLFGDRLLVANATGCSSIYGGNLPTTPYTVNGDGRGPAWSNSLFEDNAEFGLGMRLAYERQQTHALTLLAELEPQLGLDLVGRIAGGYTAGDDAGIRAQRAHVAELVDRLSAIADDDPRASALIDLSTALVRRTFWIVGGDGWAYDIGYGGLDHVLASGRDVNILVMDTEVYSNTGGQQSKATPRGAVAKFAAAGKGLHKKDLGLEAMAYGDVYVAQIALGASEVQTVKALVEAEAHHGPSLVIAYSTCIAHGFDMADSMGHQKLAVNSGHWPLYRYRPAAADGSPFQLDSKAPSIPFSEFAQKEARFSMLFRSDPARAKELMARSEEDIAERWRYYEQLAGVQRAAPPPDPHGRRARLRDEVESDE